MQVESPVHRRLQVLVDNSTTNLERYEANNTLRLFELYWKYQHPDCIDCKDYGKLTRSVVIAGAARAILLNQVRLNWVEFLTDEFAGPVNYQIITKGAVPPYKAEFVVDVTLLKTPEGTDVDNRITDTVAGIYIFYRGLDSV